MGQFGKWNIESATHMQSASVIMMGVPLDITNEQLKQGVIEGLRPEAAPEAQVRVEQIAYKQLLRRRGVQHPPRGDGPNEAAATRVPSRAVRISSPTTSETTCCKKDICDCISRFMECALTSPLHSTAIIAKE